MRYKYIDKILLKHDFIKCKKKIFLLYFSYILGYTFIFFINNKTLHFEHWIFLVSMVYFINLIVILPLSEFSKKIKIWGFFLLISFFFKISLEGIEIIERILKNTSNLIINSYFGIFIFFSILYCISRASTEITNKIKRKEKLYPERKEDRRAIYNFLTVEDKFNILGIDENFGEGKSFVVNKALEMLEDSKFEVIKIRCLLPEKEEIYPYIIKQLNRVLIKNLIFTGHLEKLRNSFIKSVDGRYLGGFFNLFIRETSIDDIENFKQAIFKLNKKIILIFEDFDRNSSCEKIEKLFSFIADFSENNIKSLVLYSSKNLISIDKKYNRNYVEKYIPFTISLTQLSFRRILEREIIDREIKGLDKEDFYFLISIFEGDKNIILRDYDRNIKELKFVLDFQSLTSLNMISHINWTPRNIKNFVKETKIYINKGLKIEKRIIIAFTFLKTLFYEDFYMKIDESFSFEKTFPINLKLLKDNIDITLEDLDILNRLVLKMKSIHSIQMIEFIDIGKTRIFFNDRFKHDTRHINNYLKKLNLPILEIYSTEEIRNCLDIIEKILLENRKKIADDNYTINNILIYSLFNYFSLLRNDENKVMENNEKIVNAIKKLKSLGKIEYLSSQRRYYEKLIDCLKKKDKKEQLDSYNGLIDEYYHCDGSFESVFYFGETFEEKSMLILDVFDDGKNKEKFLELIYYRDNNKITDNYLTTFLKVKIQNIKIADSILNNFLKNNFEITDRDTLNLIRRNINKIIIREECPYPLDDLSNVEFYRNYIDYLKEMVKKDSFHNLRTSIVNKSEVIKANIEKSIKFLNILIELENNSNIKERNNFEISLKYSLPEEIEKIKSLTDEEEKIKKIEEIYINEGKKIEYIQQIYEKVKG